MCLSKIRIQNFKRMSKDKKLRKHVNILVWKYLKSKPSFINNQSMNILLFGIKWALYKTAPPLDYVICELWLFGLITRVEQGDLEDAFNSLSWLLRGSICNTFEHSWRSGVLDAKGATNDPGPTLRKAFLEVHCIRTTFVNQFVNSGNSKSFGYAIWTWVGGYPPLSWKQQKMLASTEVYFCIINFQ